MPATYSPSKVPIVLDLPEQVQAHIDEGTFAPSVGVELYKIESAEAQVEIAERIVTEGMNRTEASAAVKTRKAPAGQGRGGKKPAPAREKTITFKTQGRCVVTLAFKKPPSDDDIRGHWGRFSAKCLKPRQRDSRT